MIRVPSAIRTGLFVCLWGLQTACESTLTNDVFSADVAYLDAVPRRAVLHLAGAPTVETSVQTAGLETATRALGPNPAELWRLTREITWQIDHQIFGVLSEVEAVVEAPPTERGDARRIWGPYREALSPVEVRLVVSRRLPGHFEYAYEQRPPGGEYVAPVRGTWAPSRGLFGSGTVLFDFAAAGGAGRVEVDFERHAGGVDFVLDLEGLADETTGEAADAPYEARRDENGAGELAFTWQSGRRCGPRRRHRLVGRGGGRDRRVLGRPLRARLRAGPRRHRRRPGAVCFRRRRGLTSGARVLRPGGVSRCSLAKTGR
jgi:hypothetical protein